jgi:hypothetical protein
MECEHWDLMKKNVGHIIHSHHTYQKERSNYARIGPRVNAEMSVYFLCGFQR